MKHIKINRNEGPEYPVGDDMIKAMNYIRIITKAFKELNINKGLNLWCTGSSGAILAALFSTEVDNPTVICHVKKSGEESHSESNWGMDEYLNVFIDDHICSGETFMRVLKKYKMYYTEEFDIIIVAFGWEGMNRAYNPSFLISGDRFILDEDTPEESREVSIQPSMLQDIKTTAPELEF